MSYNNYDLKNSLNLSNEFRLKNLDDPINYKISQVRPEETQKELADLYKTKKRIVKERDSLGGFRIPMDVLKKRSNPSEDYQAELERQIYLKKQLLNSYTMNGSSLQPSKSYNNNLRSSVPVKNNFTLLEDNDLMRLSTFNQDVTTSDNLIKMIDAKVNLLKQQSVQQLSELSKSNDFNIKIGKNGRQIVDSMLNGDLTEPKVNTQFLAANDNRIQALKHVQTQQKPEYYNLDELERIKEEHEKKILDIEDEYYGRKKISEEELERRRQAKIRLENAKRFGKMIRRPGYNNDNPLEQKDIDFINKFGNYLENKGNFYPQKLGYEEEWNTTKIKSQNANGIVDRNDNLPGFIDTDDHTFYYYDIEQDAKQLNFERPLKVHPHHGMENTLLRTFRNEPDYLQTRDKFYNTGEVRDPSFYVGKTGSGFMGREESKFNQTMPQFNNKSMKLDRTEGNKMGNTFNNSLNESKQPTSFIKMIFNKLDDKNQGYVPKQNLAENMKLNDEIISELGFTNKEDFEKKLKDYKTRNPNYLEQEEFIDFMMNKGSTNENFYYSTMNTFPKKNMPIDKASPNKSPNTTAKKIENVNASISIPPEKLFSLTGPLYNKSSAGDDTLPGMSTHVMDFLRNPSTNARLRYLNKKLGKSRSTNKLNRSARSFKEIPHLRKNKSLDNINPSLLNSTDNIYYESRFPYGLSQKYHRKSDINFTVPEPFDFLKKDYHRKKLSKMQEILEERKKNEEQVFKHRFRANSLNKKMFDTKGDLRNVIEREKSARKERVQKLKEEIQKDMCPFSFYDADFESFVKRKSQEYQAPKFVPFKANPIQWKSQVNMYEQISQNGTTERQKRIKERALRTYNNASLPPRMEMHEKQKKLQQQEQILIENKRQEELDQRRLFKAKDVPNFARKQAAFLKALDEKKSVAKPTVPKPFTFHEPKKKMELCEFLDFENDPQFKNPNPKKSKDINEIKRRMNKKPKIEPRTNTALNLLMETRRKELEQKKKAEEEIKREDQARYIKQNRLNQRVRMGMKEVEQEREKKLEELGIGKKKVKEDFGRYKSEYKQKLDMIKQRVENRDLLLELDLKRQKVMDDNTEQKVAEAFKESRKQNIENSGNFVENSGNAITTTVIKEYIPY